MVWPSPQDYRDYCTSCDDSGHSTFDDVGINTEININLYLGFSTWKEIFHWLPAYLYNSSQLNLFINIKNNI